MKTIERHHIRIRGMVQGVGFRPFVYRVATELNLNGWVCNTRGGVDVEVEGDCRAQEKLLHRLRTEAPVPSFIRSMETHAVLPTGEPGFGIRESHDVDGACSTEVLADQATCPDCIREIFDPKDRRYLYPFTNCMRCGPRYTVITHMPYDRCRTSLGDFSMCDQCRAEYQDPTNRRFHAQTIACPTCGPQIEWRAAGQSSGIRQGQALKEVVDVLGKGGSVAVKGVGGFHLFVDATREEAVRKLRGCKRREAKPFAVMFASLESIQEECEVSPLEADLLTSAAAPIVLLRRRGDRSRLAPAVVPDNPCLGAMLPYTGLHHILMRMLGRPLVATSGNLGGEPICFENESAQLRLRHLVDGFLMHNYEIQRGVDDSVLRVAAGRELALRRSRGYVPLSIDVGGDLTPVLALGGDLKNTIALTNGTKVHVSQHLGDLSNAHALDGLQEQCIGFPRLLGVASSLVARDSHPGYFGSKAALGSGVDTIAIQHHHAHVASCLADNGVDDEVLGVVWDGSGFGTDGTVWGGEFLLASMDGFERVNHLRPFGLLGAEQAIKRPPLVALGLLFELGLKLPSDLVAEFSQRELSNYKTMWERSLNCPATSSMGRLFDGVAALAGLSQRNRFEGESAMRLEFAISPSGSDEAYETPKGRPLNWARTMCQILDDLRDRVVPGIISLRFHNALVNLICNVARELNRPAVALTGGCFQNRYLLERSVKKLRVAGFEPLWHKQVPPNDGGLALGQACIASRRARKY